jgi:hypothetical protein
MQPGDFILRFYFVAIFWISSTATSTAPFDPSLQDHRIAACRPRF